MMEELIRIPEPLLLFRHGQASEDPRDGLTLFGPLDQGKPYGIKTGVIGTKRGIDILSRWVEWVQRPVFIQPSPLGRPPFPGFETAFRTPWSSKPVLTVEVDDEEIDRHLYLDDRHQRVYGTVNVFANQILRALKEEEAKPELWFVIVPDRVYKYCRPESVVEPDVRMKARVQFKSASKARNFYETRSLFVDIDDAVPAYFYEEHFHNQLKARLLNDMVLTQFARESVLGNVGKLGEEGISAREVRRQSEIAWNLSTGVFYKVGGRPWKVASIREGVCYVGLVFKKDETGGDQRNACCAAQMFLDSGDGVVFKGAVGPWYNEDTGDYHLSRSAAKSLGDLVINSYKSKFSGQPPSEVFIHGKVRFNREEWRGFEEAASEATNIVGVRIRDELNLKLYRKGQNPILRGLAHIRGERSAHLWTKGWIPRIQTYPGRGVPNPLVIELNKGEAPINTVLQDILTLTKLNYNTCIFGDGLPITLKFANAVGEILTAGFDQRRPAPAVQSLHLAGLRPLVAMDSVKSGRNPLTMVAARAMSIASLPKE
jgi:hypothetical protein